MKKSALWVAKARSTEPNTVIGSEATLAEIIPVIISRIAKIISIVFFILLFDINFLIVLPKRAQIVIEGKQTMGAIKVIKNKYGIGIKN